MLVKRFITWLQWRSYLKRRGWSRDKNGWYQLFDPDLPKDHWAYNKPRWQTKKGIDIIEAVKLVRYADPSSKYIYTK